jgi:multidrug efflux pump
MRSISDPFVHRPVGTTLLTLAVALAGALAYNLLPVSPLPQVDFPTIQVQASLPGANPETMASAVATPLERQFGRIAGVTEMTSTSYLGSTTVVLQFELNRNIDAAARDVQAAINAAAGNLPSNLPALPTYRKVNPADAPVMILAITSDLYDRAHMYDSASSILSQRLSQVDGVGQVTVGGGALPAVRIEVNPAALNNLNLSLEDVRTMLGNANVNSAKGQVADATRAWSLSTTDQLLKAKQYQPLIVTQNAGAPVRLTDIGTVIDSVEDVRTEGEANSRPAIPIIIFRQPGANIIQTVDRVRALMPQLQAELPAAMRLAVVMDRTPTIRDSVHEVEITLCISISLVILVVFVFLRSVRITLIPSVAVPVSLIGTFGVMYLAGYSLDNLSLMALTISTGFVVDDAIVVIENVTRHLEAGMTPMAAALQGAREIGFTVVSISISLVAVFTPILLMSGVVGRLFREFAVTLSVAIAVSMVVSLTTTPMMCAHLLKPHVPDKPGGRANALGQRIFDRILAGYASTLKTILHHPAITLTVLLLTIALNVALYIAVPKGFFPQQDTGRLNGSIQADQDTSFQSLSRLMNRFSTIVTHDPDVTDVIDFAGGAGQTSNTGRMFVSLKSYNERKLNATQIVDRLRRNLSVVAGATLYLQPVQDLNIGGRRSNAQYQFTLQSNSVTELNTWAPRMLQGMRKIPGLTDVNSDQQDAGLQASLSIDRPTAARLGISTQALDDTLYDAFGQRQVSTMYTPLNQYHVVMEVDPKFWQNPDGLKYIYVRSGSNSLVPLAAVTRYTPNTTSLAVNHQGQFPSVTISFNLREGISLGDVVTKIQKLERDMGLPATTQGTFAGTAQAFQQSLSTQPMLILFALLAVYIVLGILYESYVHPITILSTLPSAGVGALLALLLFHAELDLIALIGIILLIGIVKKNAILMIDFALSVERSEGLPPAEAIYRACVLRFRPITMTTMCAMLGGLPLALGHGAGAELRRPLGISIVGGLIFSQMLTLYTTPVVYLYLDRLRLWLLGKERPQHALPHVQLQHA